MPARAAKLRVGSAGKAVLNRLCLKFLLDCPRSKSKRHGDGRTTPSAAAEELFARLRLFRQTPRRARVPDPRHFRFGRAHHFLRERERAGDGRAAYSAAEQNAARTGAVAPRR